MEFPKRQKVAMKHAKPTPESASAGTKSSEAFIDRRIIFETLKENRDTYYASYCPARTDSGFATLVLTFVGQPSRTDIVALMEHECRVWLKRFPVPIQATASDDTDTVLRPHQDEKLFYIMALPTSDDLELHWCGLDSPPLALPPISEERLLEIYAAIPNSTIEERKSGAAQNAKSVKFGWILVVAWIAGIPVLIAILGLASPLFGIICAAYSIYVGIAKALEMLGYKKKSGRKKEAEDLEAKMKHYFYHCEQNPEAFNRLKLENSKRESREETIKEKENLKK